MKLKYSHIFLWVMLLPAISHSAQSELDYDCEIKSMIGKIRYSTLSKFDKIKFWEMEKLALQYEIKHAEYLLEAEALRRKNDTIRSQLENEEHELLLRRYGLTSNANLPPNLKQKIDNSLRDTQSMLDQLNESRRQASYRRYEKCTKIIEQKISSLK